MTKCMICGQFIAHKEPTSTCGKNPYHSFHDNEEKTKNIPYTWAYSEERRKQKEIDAVHNTNIKLMKERDEIYNILKNIIDSLDLFAQTHPNRDCPPINGYRKAKQIIIRFG